MSVRIKSDLTDPFLLGLFFSKAKKRRRRINEQNIYETSRRHPLHFSRHLKLLPRPPFFLFANLLCSLLHADGGPIPPISPPSIPPTFPATQPTPSPTPVVTISSSCIGATSAIRYSSSSGVNGRMCK